jgi:hypothetical protein
MNDRDRLEQLRVMVERLEGLPASENRDWMLREVRSRAVDLDTGVRPGPVRPIHHNVEIDHAAPRAPRGSAPARPARTRSGRPAVALRLPPGVPTALVRARSSDRAPRYGPAPTGGRAEPRDHADPLGVDERLSLDDQPAGEPVDSGHASPPWARGLRA